MIQRYIFPKEFRLSSKTHIESVFTTGQSLFQYPIVFKFLKVDSSHSKVQALFTCPKRKFKRAVDRNLIRRRMKESFRLLWQNHLSDSTETHLQIMMIYSSNEILPYSVINEGISKGLIQIKKSL